MAEAMITEGEKVVAGLPVDESIEQFVALSDVSASQKTGRRLWARVQRRILVGEFDVAESALNELERLNRDDTIHAYVESTYATRFELFMEQRRDANVAELAASYDKGKGMRAMPASIDRDVALAIARAEVRAGVHDKAWFEGERKHWAEQWRKAGAPESLVWLYGWASLVMDEDDAKDALAVPMDKAVTDPQLQLPIGVTYALGPDPARGASILRGATRTCQTMTLAFPETRAFAALGRALEATGDAKGACAAYQKVLDRWGKTLTPPDKSRERPSRTAEDAKQRFDKLDCKGANKP
jgi:hypothetical protein